MKLFQQMLAGENRVVLTDDQNRPLRVFIQRDMILTKDEIIRAAITAYHPTLHGYFAETVKGFVFLPTETPLTLGETVSVHVTKEPRAGKDATGRMTEEKPSDAPDIALVLSKQYLVPITEISVADMDDLIAEALETDIKLPRGGEFHIERTRTAWMIDVDSASSTDTLDSINREAVSEIARQIILKNMGGLILIDFAGSKRGAFKQAIEPEIKQAFAEDTLAKLSGWTPAGLYEIQRRREEASLLEKCSPNNPIAVYYQIRRAAAEYRSGKPVIYAAPCVLALLRSSELIAEYHPLYDQPLSVFEIKESLHG